MTKVKRMDATSGTPATDAPLHEVRETLRSVELPTAAQSPWGPVRKNQPKPPVAIPGQRKPSSSISPRPAPPQSRFAPKPDQVATWRSLAAVVVNSDTGNKGAYDEAYHALQQREPIDCHANHCFSDGAA